MASHLLRSGFRCGRDRAPGQKPAGGRIMRTDGALRRGRHRLFREDGGDDRKDPEPGQWSGSLLYRYGCGGTHGGHPVLPAPDSGRGRAGAGRKPHLSGPGRGPGPDVHPAVHLRHHRHGEGGHDLPPQYCVQRLCDVQVFPDPGAGHRAVHPAGASCV